MTRDVNIIIIIIYPLTMRVVGAPQMISQPVSSIFPCSPVPSGTWRTPGLSIPWCCLPTSSSVCLVFFPLPLCLARWFWPDLMNGRHDDATAVCISLQWSGGLRVVRLPAGSWQGLPRWWHGLCMRCVVPCGSTSFPWLVFFSGAMPYWLLEPVTLKLLNPFSYCFCYWSTENPDKHLESKNT